MPVIETRRHLLNFYATIFFGFIFLIGLGTIIMLAGIHALDKQHPEVGDYFLPIVALGTYFVAFSLVYYYFKNAPTIAVDNRTITIGGENYRLKDIKSIQLTGKRKFRFLIDFSKEGAMLIFKDGTKKIFFDDLYTNTWELKSFLRKVVVLREEYVGDLEIKDDRGAMRVVSEETFKGHQLTSGRGLTLWSGIVLAIYFLFTAMPLPTGAVVFLLSFVIGWFVLHSWLMYYFIIADDYLIVKNHNFFWTEQIFRLDYVKEVIYETQARQPNSLRIISKDFRNNLYRAGTLTDEMWLDMKMKLESKGVRVRNECIF